jgi:sugar phosphate isomerase/epimerase
MTAKIALQLYSIRDSLPKDFAGGIKRVAEMGYDGVESAGFEGTTPKEAGKIYKQHHLTVCSAHVFPPPLGDKFKETLDILADIGCKHIVSGFGPDNYASIEATKRSCDILNQTNALAQKSGISFSIHNHWWEYLTIEGTHPYKVMLQHLDPTVCFELDVYWVKTGGVDPVAVVKEVGKRAPLLHIKDGPAVRDQPMTAVGDGVVDIPGVVKAGKGSTEWLIVELDACATDMIEAVAKSQKYLKKLV